MDIGIIGYGNVGKAFVKLLIDKNIECNIKYIIKSDGGIYNNNGIDKQTLLKEENIKLNNYWIDNLTFFDIDEKVDYLVELTSTNMKTGEPAATYIKLALNKGINVVTGNKGPILLQYNSLKEIAEKNRVHLGIGCTVGGALPSFIVGSYAIAGANVEGIEGILNGTTNFILSNMQNNNINFKESLKEAQDLGIAEKDPTMDVGGFDTAIKMIILANVLMQGEVKLEDVDIKGIEDVNFNKINTKMNGLGKIKLLGRAIKKDNRINISVKPEVIYSNNPLYNVDGRNKGVCYKTDTLGDITITGGASDKRGAAAAILRDILNIDLVLGGK